MSNLTIKQKIILGVVIGIMLIVIGIYGYISLNRSDDIELEEISNEQITNNEIVSNEIINNDNEQKTNQNNIDNIYRTKRNYK